MQNNLKLDFSQISLTLHRWFTFYLSFCFQAFLTELINMHVRFLHCSFIKSALFLVIHCHFPYWISYQHKIPQRFPDLAQKIISCLAIFHGYKTIKRYFLKNKTVQTVQQTDNTTSNGNKNQRFPVCIKMKNYDHTKN